jgi:hypothetical protein
MGTDKETEAKVFGIPMPPQVQRKGQRLRAGFEKKYAFDANAQYSLRARDNEILGPFLGLKDVFCGEEGEPLDAAKGVVVGTIRMGYGHYRMAMAIASAARALGYTPYWFDLLAFDTPGAKMIHDIDYWYSLGSRLSQCSRLFNKLLWDPLMGKWYKRVDKNFPIMEASRIFAPIYRALPPDMPVVGSHPWTALGAVYADMKKVVNIIPDNCPLGFHLVEGARHTVQGMGAYLKFLLLQDLDAPGENTPPVPADRIIPTGHYIDHELVANIDEDCNARGARMAKKAPRRLLVSIGGAGAQQQLVADLVSYLEPQIEKSEVALFLNCGDHTRAWKFLCKAVNNFERSTTRHFEWDETTNFIAAARTGEVSGVHTFLNPNPFCAVYTTNLLMRASDVLLTKPSELAYYPIPKLMLERVGGHEAWGAIRASELGDGTIECRTFEETKKALDMLTKEDELLTLYCENIKRLNSIGTYNGAYRAVELAATGAIQS